MKIIVTFIFTLLLWSNLSAQVTGTYLIKNMVKTCKTIKTIRYTQIKKEMTNGKINKQVMNAKMQVYPFNIYFYQQEPKKGLEGLYISGKNNNELLINPNGFPWVNMNFDPYGSTVRKNNHHVVFQSGFQYMADILNKFLVDYGAKAEDNFSVYGTEQCHGFDCWKMTIKAPNFHYYDYVVKQGETLTSIANKALVNDYMILRENNLSDYDDIEQGDVIKVPSAYGKKINIWFDKENHLLRKVIIYDDKGFYESFEYPKIELNPHFKQEEFTEEYEEYGF